MCFGAWSRLDIFSPTELEAMLKSGDHDYDINKDDDDTFIDDGFIRCFAQN